MKTRWVLEKNFVKRYRSDEAFVRGVPTRTRAITEEEYKKIIASGDPGAIEWPPPMLPERIHTNEEQS